MSEQTAVTTYRVPMPVSVSGVSNDQYDRMMKFREDLEYNLPAIEAVLPKGVKAESLASTALTALMDQPKLLDCTPMSLFRAVYKAAALNLRIGETCDVVGPIKGKAECWVRVKGVVDLAKRAGAIQWAREGYVCVGDVFEYEERAEGTHFRHVPNGTPTKDGSNVTHIWAKIVLPSGLAVFDVWPMARCLAHKERFAKDTKPGSAWAEHPLAMMAKSVVKSALRFAPLSPVVLSAITAGDEVEGTFEVLGGDPAKAITAGGFDALEAMDVDTDEAPAMTLADAEAMTLPGGDKAWGGKGGQMLGTLKDSLLSSVVKWIDGDAERGAKFAALKVACEIILGARQDAELSEEIAAAA